MLTPTEKQQEWIDKFVHTDSVGGILGLGTGVGKSLAGVEIIKGRGAKRALIIAPNSTFDGWANHVEWQLGGKLLRCANTASQYTRVPDHTDRMNMETVRITAAEAQANLLACQSGEPGIYFTGREFFASQCFKKSKHGGKKIRLNSWDKKAPFDVVLFDENQQAATPGNAQERAWRYLKASMKIPSSADWFGSRVENMYYVARDLWGDKWMKSEFGDFDTWVDEWMEKEYNHFSYRKYDVVGEQWPGAFAHTLPLYVTAPPSVTPPRPERRIVDLSREERSIYEQFNKNLAAMIDSNLLVAENALTLRIRLRELSLAAFNVVDLEDGKQTIEFKPGAKSSKLEEVKRILSDYPDEKFVIFTHSAKWARWAASEMKSALSWTGSLSDSERKGVKEEFMSGDTRVLIATPEAAGVGIDGLQRVCRNVIFVSYSDQPLMNDQAIARIARTGQEHSVNVWEILARDTYDLGQVSNLLEAALIRSGSKGWSL